MVYSPLGSPPVLAGTESGGTCQRTSPPTPKGSRLVASTLRRGHESRRVSTSSAAASTRCSQLSTTRSNSLSTKASTNVSVSGLAGTLWHPQSPGYLLSHQISLW